MVRRAAVTTLVGGVPFHGGQRSVVLETHEQYDREPPWLRRWQELLADPRTRWSMC